MSQVGTDPKPCQDLDWDEERGGWRCACPACGRRQYLALLLRAGTSVMVLSKVAEEASAKAEDVWLLFRYSGSPRRWVMWRREQTEGAVKSAAASITDPTHIAHIPIPRGGSQKGDN